MSKQEDCFCLLILKWPKLRHRRPPRVHWTTSDEQWDFIPRTWFALGPETPPSLLKRLCEWVMTSSHNILSHTLLVFVITWLAHPLCSLQYTWPLEPLGAGPNRVSPSSLSPFRAMPYFWLWTIFYIARTFWVLRDKAMCDSQPSTM